jgi:uncharacterized membrane protein YdjX (TVP38/TMEM64 family)
MTGPSTMPLEPAQPLRLTRFLPAALIIGAMLAFWGFGLHRYVSLQAVIDNRAALLSAIEAHQIRAILIFGLVYAAAVAVSFPGASLLTIAAGLLFGMVTGAAVVVVAATIGACLVFLAARSSLGEGLVRRAGPFLGRLREGFRENAFSYLLALRLAPVFPFWLVNLAPALLGMDLRTYALATAIGIIPGSLAFAAIGSGLDSVIAAQMERFEACRATGGQDCSFSVDPTALVTPQLLLALGGLAIIAFIPIGVKAWRKRAAR